MASTEEEEQREGGRVMHRQLIAFSDKITDLQAQLDRATKPRPNECWSCKVSLELPGTPESRVPRCNQCPEPESLDEVDGMDPTS